ncbi:MAG: hypothetical protein FWD03_03105 [Defluviitaleaceae bacterium]|nr:hypothetical protein [Defluviitaleaceae bacterium]
MKIAQILDNKIHWITPYKKWDKVPEFASDIILKEIPNNAQEGWIWDVETETFYDPAAYKHYAVLDADNFLIGIEDTLEKRPDRIETEMWAQHMPPDLVYFEGEFIDTHHYISRRFDRIEKLLGKKTKTLK